VKNEKIGLANENVRRNFPHSGSDRIRPVEWEKLKNSHSSSTLGICFFNVILHIDGDILWYSMSPSMTLVVLVINNTAIING
jgi:hypothetical protein